MKFYLVATWHTMGNLHNFENEVNFSEINRICVDFGQNIVTFWSEAWRVLTNIPFILSCPTSLFLFYILCLFSEENAFLIQNSL